MHDQIARHVHQVFKYALELKERLERGDRLHFEAEQTKLRGLLVGDSELCYLPEYAGDASNLSLGSPRTPDGATRGPEPFLGIRYALTCWVDEVFVTDSSWRDQWTAAPLEVALYGGTTLRATRFWEQTKKSEARPGTDGPEVFFWCVMLGFRGEPASAGIDLAQWIEAVRKRVSSGYAHDFPLPHEKEPPTFVPALRGRDGFRAMLHVAVGFAALVVVAVTCLLLRNPTGQ
jgi:type VI secretion system protein ImpK